MWNRGDARYVSTRGPEKRSHPLRAFAVGNGEPNTPPADLGQGKSLAPSRLGFVIIPHLLRSLGVETYER